MVRDDGDVVGGVGVFRRADRADVWDDGPRGHDFAVFRRDDRRSIFCDAAAARGPASRRRRRVVLCVGADGVLASLHRGVDPHAVLYADACADQLAVVPPDARSGSGISAGARAGHDWLDRRWPCRRHARRRSDRTSDAAGGGRLGPDGRLLPAPSPYTAAEHGQRARSRCPGTRRTRVDEGSVVRGVRHRIVSGLHPAAVLLRVRKPVLQRHWCDERRRQDDDGTDVRAGVHASDAVVLPAPRRETDAARRHGGLGGALHPVCVW